MFAQRWAKALFLLAVVVVPALGTQAAEADEYGGFAWSWRYGNWGGGGFSNGVDGGNVWGDVEPVDLLDAVFRDHDRDYARADERYGAAYREAFRIAAKSIRTKHRRYSDSKVRGLARKESAVSKAWKKWKDAYEKADDKAVKAAKGLTEYPGGFDKKKRKLKGKTWAAFRGTGHVPDDKRRDKRMDFITWGDTWVMNNPDRETVEDEELLNLHFL